MQKVQKTYTQEFKREAARLAQTSRKPIAQVARELSISDTSIHQWRKELQLWLLSAALLAHPSEELPFSELVRLPEFFPFRLTIGVQDVRESARFEVNRQGMSWDMVALAGPRHRTIAPSL